MRDWQQRLLVGVDAVSIRGAACEPGTGPGRFGQVRAALVKELVATIPVQDNVEPGTAKIIHPAEPSELTTY